ncbi:hypothetical protein ACHAWU_003847 [Discostella pseudostelligera]|uniref:Uncharacterized protein n=1 Tax=Discostella pseudostelligera TaxID=259834 RepID=A0ABD3MFI0_9STRA
MTAPRRSSSCCRTIILFFFISNITLAFTARSSSLSSVFVSSKTPFFGGSVKYPPSASATPSCCHDHNLNDVDNNTRRQFVTSYFLRPISASIVTSGRFASYLEPANAATTSPSSSSLQEQKDKDNLVRGYNRLQYLLDNWEEETTVCKIGQETTFGDKCERTPTKVMEYLGFKSTNDPLFKADTTMMRLKDVIPSYNSNREAEYYEAIDSFVQNSEEANSMAFVSSWGEANPGGGKDRVRLFIERSKKNVMASRDGLRTVMEILDLKP